MNTSRRLSTLMAMLVALGGCDPYFQVIVTVPMARRLPMACAESSFDRIANPRRPNPADPQGPPLRGIAFVDGLPYADLKQHEYPDSTAALETSVGRISFRGGRFSKAEEDIIVRDLSATLIKVRDACGGTALAEARPYRVQQKPF